MKIQDPVLRAEYNRVMREYCKEKYDTDPEYKKKRLEANRRWRQKFPEKWNKIQQNAYRRKKEEMKDGKLEQ